MTPEEKFQLRQNISKLFMEHLKELGYPDMTNEEILNELPEMWKKMCNSGFYKEGMSYQSFVEQAYQQAILSDFLNGIGR